MDGLLFWILAFGAVAASVLVIGQRNPMYSVLLLIVSFAALSGLYVLLGAPFVAAIQIIIYAGAIMVLFLFVVMLLNVPTEDPPVRHPRRLLSGAGPRRFGRRRHDPAMPAPDHAYIKSACLRSDYSRPRC